MKKNTVTSKNKKTNPKNKIQSANVMITSSSVSSDLRKVKDKKTIPKTLKIKTEITTKKKRITNKVLTEKKITNENLKKSRQVTGYQLYLKESSSLISPNMVKQNIVDLAKNWKVLSETEKNTYNTRAKDMPVS